MKLRDMRLMELLHDLARVCSAIAFIGVAICWTTTISCDVKSFEVDVLGMRS